MQKVLRKRVLRSLKKHLFRYFALGLMIAMGIFLVVTIVGSAETLTKGTEDLAQKTNLEDGEFEVFVPLSKTDKNNILEMGLDIEEHFFFDYQRDDADKSTVRIFKLRESIDKIHYIEGKEPANKDEIVIEKRYAIEHKLNLGDTLEIADKNYTISGIGVVSDYDGPLKEISDTACNSVAFGLVFMTKEAYKEFKTSGKTQKTENYIYAYKLGNDMTNSDLKNYLKDIKIDSSEVDDKYFQEYWDEKVGDTDKLRDAVKDLHNATEDVEDGLEKLTENNDDINDATAKILDNYLEETTNSLNENNINIKLTEKNYEKELEKLIESSSSAITRLTLDNTKNEITKVKEYKEGILGYTKGVKKLHDGIGDMNDGVADMDDSVDEMLNDNDFKLSNLTMFLEYADNPRIYATKNDKIVDIEVGMIAGVIIFILFAYVISVFVVNSIENESSIIGTLYSMGVTKNDLLAHYITLPVVVTFIAGLIGVLVASTGLLAPMVADSSYEYYSIPVFGFNIPLYLWIYSVAVPPIIAIIVNVLVIRSKLNKPVLSLIRNEVKKNETSKIKLKGMNFVSAFRIRQMLREIRSTLAVILGMFLAMLIFMIAVTCFSLCSNIAKDYEKDTKYEYMYNLKYPKKEVPEGGEAAYAYTCKAKTQGYNFDITMLGIDDDNPYFDFKPSDSKINVLVSSSFAEKFGLEEGKEFVITDDDKEINYAFSVKEIVNYSTGYYIFMDIDLMRDMMGESNDYYNVVFSDKKLDIEAGRLYSVITRDDIVKGSSVFTSLMLPMVFVLSFASIIIFFVVMYLMMKVMLDRSSYNISLIKVFGYKSKEIRKLYMDGNFYIIAIGSLICLPLSKIIINKLFPFMISNVACGLNVKAPISFFIIAYIVILLLYFIINKILVKRLNKFTPAEVLKNRE